MSSVSVDLETLQNFAALAEGQYELTVIAKGNPEKYIDSNPSEGVSWTKTPSGYQVTIINDSDASWDWMYVYEGSGTEQEITTYTQVDEYTRIYLLASGNYHIYAGGIEMSGSSATGDVSITEEWGYSVYISVSGNGTLTVRGNLE